MKKSVVVNIRFTAENTPLFHATDWRLGEKIFWDDVKILIKKMVAYQKGKKNELTKRYPGRYDLTVFTYSQDAPDSPRLINDGSHRLQALNIIFKKKMLKYFDAWLIPSNIIGAETHREALFLNDHVNKELDKVGLPHWVKKFDFEMRGDQLVAWKNINLIDTGGEDTRLQYGVNWFLNDDPRRKLVDVDEHNYKNKYKL